MTLFTKHLLIWWIASLLIGASVHASAPQNNNSASRTQVNQADMPWAYLPWKGSGKPFQAIRLTIDKQINQGADPYRLFARLNGEAEKHPYDAIAQFRAAYVVLKLAEATQFSSNADQAYHVWELLQPAEDALARVMPPYTYEYDRLRFLIDARCMQGKGLKVLGKRLVHHNPDDYNVLFQLVHLQANPYSQSEKKDAIFYAVRCTQIAPKRPDAYALLGSVYYNNWILSKSKRDADKAIVALNGYFRVASSQDALQTKMKSLVDEIQHGPHLSYDATSETLKHLQDKMKRFEESPQYKALHPSVASK